MQRQKQRQAQRHRRGWRYAVRPGPERGSGPRSWWRSRSPGGRCSGEVDKLRLDSLREERRESWTRDDRPLAAAWTVEHHRWCLVWLRAGWLVSDRNHKRNFKRVTVLAQVRGPAQITRMQREEDALGRCQPGPEPGAWDDAKESPQAGQGT